MTGFHSKTPNDRRLSGFFNRGNVIQPIVFDGTEVFTRVKPQKSITADINPARIIPLLNH
jgi:hypothetical protein